MWEIENRSPFPHRGSFLRDHEARTFWCLHLKASFALRPGQSRPLAIGAFARLDESHPGTEVAHCQLGATIGAVIEGLVSTTAEIEDYPHVEALARGDRVGSSGAHEE